jgi:hypothetical protein
MELISTLGHLHGDLKVTLGLGDLLVRQLGSGDRRRHALLGLSFGITRRFGKTAPHVSNTPTNATEAARIFLVFCHLFVLAPNAPTLFLEVSFILGSFVKNVVKDMARGSTDG